MILVPQPCAARAGSRRGGVLPMLALALVVLISFLALAIDLGMVAIAKTQVQNAADLAVLTAARTVNGQASLNYNQSAATSNAQNILTGVLQIARHDC